MEPPLRVELGRDAIEDLLPVTTWLELQRYPTAWNPDEQRVSWWVPEPEFLVLCLRHPDVPWRWERLQGQ